MHPLRQGQQEPSSRGHVLANKPRPPRYRLRRRAGPRPTQPLKRRTGKAIGRFEIGLAVPAAVRFVCGAAILVCGAQVGAGALVALSVRRRRAASCVLAFADDSLDVVYEQPGSMSAQGVRRFREAALERGVVVPSGGGPPRQLSPVAIGREEASGLATWVRREGARRTIEAGLGFGIATLSICEGLLANGGDVSHVAADPYQVVGLPVHSTTYEGVGLQLLEEAGVRELVEFHAEESQIVFPRLLAAGRDFDLAFIDGNHRFEAVFLDLIYTGRLLNERGIVFIDDVQLPGPRRALQFCVNNLGWVVEDGGTEGDAHEWAVARTGLHDAFQRPYTDFREF